MRIRPAAAGCWLILSLLGQLLSPGFATGLDTLRIGYSIKTILDINVQDAEAATAVQATHLAQRKGLDLEIETHFYEDMEDLLHDLNTGHLHLVNLVGYEHIELAPRADLDAALVPIRRGSVYEQLVFIISARQDTHRALASFAHERILVSLSNNEDLASLWLTGLSRLQAPSSPSFELEIAGRVSDAVLPVLLGDAAACIVFRNSLETMIELNPQIGRDLIIWRSSPRILMSVLSFNRQVEIPSEEALREGILTLRDEPEGRQMLDLFRVEGHLPYKSEYELELRQMMQLAAPVEADTP